ncbi:MAG: nucleotidyltransferase family protein [Gemmatimonadetes bacterium]|nr:nucleotidyltransferase family protein [Gemmatimonadota bacterium]
MTHPSTRARRERARVDAIILAAGAAKRFGGDKLTARLSGAPLITHAIEAVLVAGFPCTVVINPGHAKRIRSAVEDRRVSIVENARAAEGMASSIRAGIRSLDAESGAALIAMGDQPLIRPVLLQQIAAQWRATAATIVATAYRGVLAPPALFDRAVFDELLELEGDIGARQVIERDGDRVVLIDIDQPPPFDVDTAADLLAVEEVMRAAHARQRGH